MNTPPVEYLEFQRQGGDTFASVVLADWTNTDVPGGTTSCNIATNGGTCTLKGLPNDLQITRTGAFNTKVGFEYAPGQANQDVNNFAWNSEMTGNGRGSATNDGSPLRYCRVTAGSVPNTQDFECWFPCYENANGM